MNQRNSRPTACDQPHAPPNVREAPSHPARPALSAAEQALVAALVNEGLSIQDRFKPEPLFKQTNRGHYQSRSAEEIRKAKEPPPQQ
jgi:hypothetical protein